ncbi:MAG TPA: GNAT family N-acetyltransferase [Methylomirabilota bacterium]|nr:GNAT family N-acetyltransferase [Methylomirabilota bacterium]
MRPPTLADAPALFARYAQDPLVTRQLTWRPHDTVEHTRTFLRRCQAGIEDGSVLPWVLTERDDGAPVGMVELRPSGHRAELGFVLARDRWGRGLMTEAAGAVVEWGLAQPLIFRVWAVTDVDNRASARVLEKLGMQREGLLRRWLVHPSLSPEPRDCWCFARVR